MPKKILIVDDDPVMIEQIEEELKKHHYQVYKADDAMKGYQEAVKRLPDLIIMDNLMPKISGYHFVEKVMPYEEKIRNTPIIILSEKKGMRDLFDLNHIAGFLEKPLNYEELLEIIRARIGESNEKDTRPQIPNAVVIYTAEEFIFSKLKPFLEGMEYKVIRAMNEEDTVKSARDFQPVFLLCQYFEDLEKHNTEKLVKDLNADFRTRDIPLFGFAPEALGMDAMKVFPRDSLLIYSQSTDLHEKLEAGIKAKGLEARSQ